jgi:hypothetical protein
MNLVNINSFNEIIIKPNSLIICDIDETILKFDNINPKWWKDTFDYYYSISKDYDFSDAKTLESWTEYIKKNNPIPIDYQGLINFFNKINKNNCELIFITARINELVDLTKHHFNCININNINYKTYHIGDTPKGEFIKSNIQINNYEHTIFIDDLITNLENVYDNFSNKIILYKFNMLE